MKKVFLTLGLIVLIGAGAAWYFVTYRLDGLIETEIEKAATVAMGSRVEVGGVSTDIRGGTLRVSQISVANPPGFENPHAVRFNGIEASVDYENLEIKRVVIDNPDFFIEERGGKTNFGQMLETIEQNAPPVDPDAADEPEIVIRHFRIDKTRAALESHSFDRFTDVEVDAIEMHNLRGTPTELAEQIAREVVGELSSEAAGALLEAEARKRLGDVQEKVSGKLRGLLGGDDESEEDDDGE
ncbi:hypothetical protein [Elongatibacter sediminis]|uniref:AsmA domain-containing protein n=1 Tax=Elongatibacter sediminis TaxID=3119006 RepID=A0AAW9REN2_9GAMM